MPMQNREKIIVIARNYLYPVIMQHHEAIWGKRVKALFQALSIQYFYPGKRAKLIDQFSKQTIQYGNWERTHPCVPERLGIINSEVRRAQAHLVSDEQ